MPASMLSNKLPMYQSKLNQIRSTLLGDVAKNFKNSQSESKEPVADITDDATRNYTNQLMTNLGEQDWEKLKQVDEALDKIKDGSYGTCSTCEQPIPEARLDVQPFAKFCVECLSKMENETQHPTPGMPEDITGGTI
jgi:DnaK suppressor protein